MNSFEDNLDKLDKITEDIKNSDISLEEAIKDFEEGMKLAKEMEKYLDEVEEKIQILTNEPYYADSGEKTKSKGKKSKTEKKEMPQLDLFIDDKEINGTRK